MSDSILHLKEVSHVFEDGFKGIRDITLCVDKGEFIIVAGKNGSGKSTLLRHLNGLLKPSSGRVLLAGNSIFDNLVNTRKTIGMVFQDADAQMVGDTVFDEVAFGLENLKQGRETIKKKVARVLEMLDLAHLKDKNPWTLSGGEKRRLAIGGVLVMDPKIIVLDEPFSNLDYPSARQVLDTIVGLNEKGHTIIIATHDIETVIYHASRMILMADGKIQQDGPPAELIEHLESFGIRQPCSSRLGLGIQPWHT